MNSDDEPSLGKYKEGYWLGVCKLPMQTQKTKATAHNITKNQLIRKQFKWGDVKQRDCEEWGTSVFGGDDVDVDDWWPILSNSTQAYRLKETSNSIKLA